jgi:hypothetical protein
VRGLTGGYAAADQLAVDCIGTADAALRTDPNPTARAARDRAYSAASDARAGMYAEAEQRHANRMAGWPDISDKPTAVPEILMPIMP